MLGIHGVSDMVVDVTVVAIPAITAAAASIYVARLARQNRDTLRAQNAVMDTGNGKDIGETIHDIAQTVEILSAQVHTNTAEVLDAHAAARTAAAKAEEASVRLQAWVTESTFVHTELLSRLPKEDGAR